MNDPMSFQYRTNQLYGWPFYFARKVLRTGAKWMHAGAEAMSLREKYPCPLFFRSLLPVNRRLKGAHAGQSCYIIGNGPSLAAHDVTALSGELTFAMNGFLNHAAFGRFQPTYYCLADPLYFDGSPQSTQFMSRLTSNATHSHLVLSYAAAQTNPAGEQITFVTFSGNLASARLRHLDLTRPIPSITNCAQLAIMVALYAGCSRIHLIGMDHDWLAHRGDDTHFYPQKTLQGHPGAHEQFWRYSYRSMIEDVLKVWKGYETLRRYAEAHGQTIVNCTEGGFLDVFERGRLQDSIRQAA